jgi:hypothetical protein
MSTETKSNPKTNISPEMQSAVGRELSRSVSYPISESDIRKWAMAIYFPEEPPRLFWDANYAATTEHGGIVAPEEFNPFAWTIEPQGARRGGEYDADQTEKTLGVKGPGLKFMLNGGMEADYFARMRPGDVITSIGRLHSYQKDELIKKMRMTLIRY